MILVCGEALIDLFVSETPAGGLKTEAVLGGSPFNVAIALARLGQKVSFCGGLSSDFFGTLLKARLMREHVDLTYSISSDCLTTLSIVATDSNGQPTYVFHGEGKADRQATEADLPTSLPASIQAITFGSYTLAVPPVADAYLALARREASRRIISLDPNLRPSVTPDMAAWHRRFNDFLALADIIKASEEDIAIAYGAEADIDNIAASWLKAGAALVCITRGANGAASYLKSGDRITVPGRAITVVDTVGAGDTFHAALLAHLSRQGMLQKAKLRNLSKEDLQRTVHYAVSVSALTCMRQGADPPTHEDVLSLLQLDGV